jgi:hypothetical protein
MRKSIPIFEPMLLRMIRHDGCPGMTRATNPNVRNDGGDPVLPTPQRYWADHFDFMPTQPTLTSAFRALFLWSEQ